MLDFKNVEKSQIQNYKKYYDYTEAIGCEYNFVGAYLWNKEYKLKIAFYDDTLIKVYFMDDDTIWGYCMPSGKNVGGAIEAIFQDAAERGQQAAFGYMSKRERDELENLYPDKFVFERSTTTQDYIYLSEDLASLAGKKFHAKRNHISKFYRTYENTHFEEITLSNFADALKVAQLWCDENDLDFSEYGEYAVIKEAVENLDELNMKGLLLYVDGKPIAMTLGTEISKLCFDVMFEKALKEYDGSYSVICNEFAKRLTEYKYINREEDLGIEGLKKSKLSYHPVIVYDRFDGVPK